jgi:hypothetical protein
MLPKLKQFLETFVVTEILTGHLKNNWTRTSLRIKNDEVTKSWNLGRAAYCKAHRTPTYSKVTRRMLVCGATLLCQKYTRYHWFCGGFRRLYNNYEKKIDVGFKCRQVHPRSDMLRLTNGFL